MDKMSGVILTSDTHITQLVNTFTDLFNSNALTDVTLVGDDKASMQAHKLVLSAGSSMFRSFFEFNTHPHPMIYLKGMKQCHLDWSLL